MDLSAILLVLRLLFHPTSGVQVLRILSKPHQVLSRLKAKRTWEFSKIMHPIEKKDAAKVDPDNMEYFK